MLRWWHLGKRGTLVTAMLVSTNVLAAETTSYSYDVLGRLVSTQISGGVADGTTVTISFDPAGNRTNYMVGGPAAPAPPCVLTASPDTEGSDEFSIFPAITRNAECAGPIELRYSVTVISGSGGFSVGVGLFSSGSSPLSGSIPPFSPPAGADLHRYLRISPFSDTIVAGNGLVLNVNWSVISGNAIFNKANTRITFCDDGGGC